MADDGTIMLGRREYDRQLSLIDKKPVAVEFQNTMVTITQFFNPDFENKGFALKRIR